jgi:hypothetical protein
VGQRVSPCLSTILAFSVSLFAGTAFGYAAGPFVLSGGLNLSISGYGAAGGAVRQSPFNWTVNGDPSLGAYGISLPFSFVLSQDERSFRQPFNQFGASPSWRWATFHAGYRNITWSPYTLGGHTFLGGGVELNPGVLRLGAVFGRFQRAVREDTTAAPAESVDQSPAYRRTGWAVKLGLGRPSNYVDIVFLKAADDSSSLPTRPVRTVLMPAENAVLGLTTRQAIGKALVFNLDAGASVYNRDQASLPLNLGSSGLRLLSRVIQPRVSTTYFLAGRTGLSLTLGGLSAVLQYERVEPEYQSMEANPLTTDLDRLTLAPTLRLWTSRLVLSGSVGSQRDNLLGSKRATTTRLVWSAGVGLYPTPTLGLDVHYANYGTRQSPGTAPVSDSTRLNQVNRSLSVAPRWTFVTGGTAHSLSLTLNQTGLADANNYTRDANNSSSTVAAFSYGLSNTGFSVSAAATWAASASDTTPTNVTGLSLTGAKPLLDGRLDLSLTPSLSRASVSNRPAATTLTVRADATYRPWTAHSFRVGASYLSNRASLPGSQSFSEVEATAGYAFNF